MPTKMPFGDATIDYTLYDVHFEMHTEDLKKHLGNIALRDLACSEGRHLSFERPEDQKSRWDCELAYDYFFRSPDMIEPEGGYVGKPMLVHIIGTHPNGCRIQLSGDAWVHVDEENERVDGSFQNPPHIMVLSGLPDDEDEAADEEPSNVVTLRNIDA